MSDHDCSYETEITRLREDITEIKSDIKSLLQFKWQIFGGVSALSIIVGTAISVLGIVK